MIFVRIIGLRTIVLTLDTIETRDRVKIYEKK